MAGRKREWPLLTAAEFDSLVRLAPGFSKDQRAVARAVMVKGETLANAGEALGWSRQRVHNAVRRLERLAETRQAAQAAHGKGQFPEQWERATLSGPPDLVAKWRTEAMRAAARQANRPAKKKPGR
jgi:hypothetical protein